MKRSVWNTFSFSAAVTRYCFWWRNCHVFRAYMCRAEYSHSTFSIFLHLHQPFIFTGQNITTCFLKNKPTWNEATQIATVLKGWKILYGIIFTFTQHWAVQCNIQHTFVHHHHPAALTKIGILLNQPPPKK